jgi:SAM-dependent methyltransferase
VSFSGEARAALSWPSFEAMTNSNDSLEKRIHENQHRLWDQEHKSPFMFPFIDSRDPSDAVVFFRAWLFARLRSLTGLCGLEMCCGKGRNVNWLATGCAQMHGFDFSVAAIEEARERAAAAGLDAKAKFTVQDAGTQWPFPDESFDFVIDCFGTTELESPEGRCVARNEALRTLRPNGFLFVAAVSAEVGYHRKLSEEAPGPFENTVYLPNGKIEAVMSEDDLRRFYACTRILHLEPHLMEDLMICGETTDCLVHWLVAKPNTGPHKGVAKGLSRPAKSPEG